MAESLSQRVHRRLRRALSLSELQLEQLERMIHTTPWSWGMSLTGALLCHQEFAGGPDGHRLGLWLQAYGVLVAVRIVAWLAWLLHPRRQAWLPAVLLPIMGSNLLMAALWGALSLLLRSQGDPQSEAVLHSTLTIVVMGGAVRLATLDRAAVVYMALVIVPLVLRDFGLGGHWQLAIPLVVTLAGVYSVLSSRTLSRALRDEYTQRRRNEELVQALRTENEQRRVAQRAAEHANDTRTRLFAAANHDLRQPLNAMALLAQTLRHAGEAPQVQEIADQMIGCTDGMAEVVDDLLDIARTGAGSPGPQWSCFDLRAFLQATCRPHRALAAAKGLGFEIDVPPATVRSDRALLARVLANLLSNAIRYTPSGQVRIGGQVADGFLRLEVADSGIGIAPEHLPRIFDEFYQVDTLARGRRQGFGLGLATVQRLGELLGLGVAVRSTPGEGSVFELRLPLADGLQRADTHGDAPPAPAAALPARVLVVDDDPHSRTALAGLLHSWGVEVRAASDPAQAMAALAEGFEPGALVIDLRLGWGASGIDLVEALRRAIGMPALPAAIVTGDVAGDPLEAARAAGLPVITKPVRHAQLRAFLGHAQARLSAHAPASP